MSLLRTTGCVVLALGLVASACSATDPEQIGANAPEQVIGEQTLRIAFSDVERIEPDDLTPDSAELALAVDLMFDSLTDFDRAIGVVTAGVADGWSTDDGIVWEFTIGAGRRFSDGSSITGGDVTASLTHAAAQGPTSAAGANLDVIAGVSEFRAGAASSISGLVAEGARTVRVVLREANYELPALLSGTALAIRPASVFAADGSVAASTVGSGRFRLASSGTGGFVFDRIGEGLGLQRVEFRRVDSPEAGLVLLAAGEVHVARNVSGTDPVRRTDYVSVPAGIAYLAFNAVDGPTASPEARAALATATDRATLSRDVFGREVAPVNSLVAGGYWAADGCGAACKFSSDAAILAVETVWPDGPPAITLDSEESAVGSVLADLIETQYEGVGLEVEQRRRSADELSLRMAAGDFDVALLGSFSAVPSPAPTLWNSFASVGRSNVGGIRSTDIDQAMRAALATPDAAARRQAFRNAERVAMAAVTVLPLVSVGPLFQVSNRVLGVDPILGLLIDAGSVSIRTR